MRSRALALGVVCLLLLAGCLAKSEPDPAPEVAEQSPEATLAEIRYQASVATDSRRPPDERNRSAQAVWSRLTALLAQPASRGIALSEWETPVRPGSGPVVRVQESEALRLYAVSIPVPGGEQLERLLAQWQGGDGKVSVSEVRAPAGSRLVSHRLQMDKGGNPGTLTLLWELPSRSGGFVGHFQWEKGEFKLVPGAFSPLPREAGTTRLEPRDGFLSLQYAPDDRWTGAGFDLNFPLRFYVHPDWYVEYQDGRYSLGDDRAPGMYVAFAEALEKTRSQEKRQAAWLKATRKLPLYLGEMEAWQEPIIDKLPKDSVLLTDQLGQIHLRLVSIPTPEFVGGQFTVLQFRNAGGMPLAQQIYLPGAPTAARLITNEGLPGLLVVSTRADGHVLTILKLGSDGFWDKAPEWYGWLPSAMDGWGLYKEDYHLFISGPKEGVVQLTGAPPTVEACADGACLQLDLRTGNRLTALPWLGTQLSRVEGAPEPEATTALEVLKSFLLLPDASGISADQFEQVLTRGRARAFSLPGLRTVGIPRSAQGLTPLVLQWDGGLHVEQPAAFGVDYWISARMLDAEHMAAVGRTQESAALVIFRKTEAGWANAMDLIQPVALMTGGIRLDAPAAQVKGLRVSGSPALTVGVSASGTTYQFCEGPGRGCVRFLWEDGRLIGPK